MAFTTEHGKTQTVLSEINMVPFIDIMLVLLIIFMITAPVIQTGIKVEVPHTQTTEAIVEDRMVVTIDADRKVYLQNKEVLADDLVDKILKQVPDAKRPSIYFSVDTTVPWGDGVAVMDRLKQGGIENISIVTQPLETPAPNKPAARRSR